MTIKKLEIKDGGFPEIGADASIVSKVIKLSEGADVIVVRDSSDSDTGHEATLDVIKEICAASDVPVIGTGAIKRLEDVKKLLYVGCDRVAFDKDCVYDKSLLEEAEKRFGEGRLCLFGSGGELTEWDGQGALVYDRSLRASIAWEELKKAENSLVPVVVQDYRTDEVLMVAYMNEEAFNRTIETGRMTYFSRSRNELWIKGETSGHYQYVRSLAADCDLDTILARVKQVGAACHTGARSCFFNEIAARSAAAKNPRRVLDDVYDVIKDRKSNPREGSYTNYLFDKGIDKILKKCGEEATEIVIAAKNPGDNEIVYEMSDFLYHMMVLMVEKGISWDDIADELSRR